MSKTIDIIRAAIEPLRADAIDRAERAVLRWVERTIEEINAAGGDIDKVAPRPHGRMDRSEYRAAQDRRAAVRGLFPMSDLMGIMMADRLVQKARQDAGASFDAYAEKLASKVGEIRAASICGASLWHGSTLTVETEAGAQRWHTQQIVNVSALGLPFNQWPTRRLK